VSPVIAIQVDIPEISEKSLAENIKKNKSVSHASTSVAADFFDSQMMQLNDRGET
jgi:hypothetical protein